MHDEDDIAQKYGYHDDESEADHGLSGEVVKTVKTMLAIVGIACVGAVGYALWNYDPPKQWDVTEQAADWWKDFSNRERKFPRKRAWDPDDLPMVDVPYEAVDVYDPSF